MTWFEFDSLIALDAPSGAVARNAAGHLYAPADTAHATPLFVTDLSGVVRTEIVANALGLIEPFRVEDHTLVHWVSGPYVIQLLSIQGVLADVLAAKAAAQASAEAATTPRTAADVTFSPSGLLDATTVQGAIEQAAMLGGTGGGGTSDVATHIWRAGAWSPVIPTTKPTGIRLVAFFGPAQPTGLPSWVGTASTQIPATYEYLATS